MTGKNKGSTVERETRGAFRFFILIKTGLNAGK
jgi:hypothetical protein